MKISHRTAGGRALWLGAAALALAGCTQLGLSTSSRGGATAPTAEALPRPEPDSRGVITYASYQVAVAREGDTMQSVADRLGIPARELASLNGLPTDYRLRQGEVLALPDSVARPGPGEVSTETLTGWSPEMAGAAIEGAPSTQTAPQRNPFQNGQTEPLIDPVRHRVEPGETAYSIARLYGVSVTALASWNGLGPDLAVRENQELLIPIVSGANQISSTPNTQPGQTTPVAPPPSAADPLPPAVVAAADPASPNLAQYRTPPGGRMQRPVNGPITRSYDLAPGPNHSEGVGFSVPAGTPVRAAAAGEVALVSDSIGGLGTIVMIRHADDIMTVYGRVANVGVERGQQVSAGQTIGVVAARDDPELHFEVRRGTESVDPTPYIGS
jgi:lipoprotein NlpD